MRFESLGRKHSADAPALLGAIGLLRAVPRLRRLIRDFRPDILHAGFVTTAGVVAALSGFRPLLLMPWGSDILLQPKRSLVRRRLAGFALGRARLITCDAEIVKREILALNPRLPEEIVVFPWGIDISLFRPDAAAREAVRRNLDWEDAEILVCTRALAPVYGVHDLVAALPSVFDRRSRAVALIIGDGPQRAELERLGAGLGLAGRVRFLGTVQNRMLPPYLAASDVYVSASHSDGSSLSLLEALACGLPVAVTDVPAILEWVEDGKHGRVAPIGEPGALADRIVELLDDDGLRAAASAINRAVAEERADWDRNFAKLEAMYARLAAGGSSAEA